MEYNNKAKLKEQNSSKLTDSKKGLAVTKGRGREKGTRCIIISTHSISRSQVRQYSTEKTSNDSTASYYAGGQ